MKRPRKRLKIAMVVEELAWKVKEESESHEMTCRAPGARLLFSGSPSETGEDYMMFDIKTSWKALKRVVESSLSIVRAPYLLIKSS